MVTSLLFQGLNSNYRKKQNQEFLEDNEGCSKAKSVMWSPNPNNTEGLCKHPQIPSAHTHHWQYFQPVIWIPAHKSVLGNIGGKEASVCVCVCDTVCVNNWWPGSPVNHRWPCTGQPAQVACYLLVTCAEFISVFDPVTDGTDSSSKQSHWLEIGGKHGCLAHEMAGIGRNHNCYRGRLGSRTVLFSPLVLLFNMVSIVPFQ